MDLAQSDTNPAAQAKTKSIGQYLSSHLRQYGLLFALIAVMAFFQIVTDGTLLRAVNVTNLDGETHDISTLPDVLADPLLERWVNGARDVEAAGEYRVYQHELTIADIGFNAESPDQASVIAIVKENAQYFLPGGAQDTGRSYDSELRVRYDLIREDERWLIKASAVL